MATSKEVVLLFYPDAVCRRDQPDLKWRVYANKKELSWGWRPGSAWNSVDHKIRASLSDEIYLNSLCTGDVPDSIMRTVNNSLVGD